MITIDMLGKPCPIPVAEAKKALNDVRNAGVTVLVDNITAVQNLEKMARGMGYGFAWDGSGERFEAVITKDGTEPAKAAEAAPVTPAEGSGLVVVIGKNAMGEGSDELGGMLIKAFIYSLAQLDPPPKAVIFYNSGVLLAVEGQNTVPDLRLLAEKGVEILACGTCCNYYGVSDRLAVGGISDMLGITERMAAAGRLINI